MFPTKWIAGVALAMASAVLLVPTAHAGRGIPSFASDDDAFAALREAARSNDAQRATDIAARLPNYAIPSYVDYFRLKPRIANAPEQEIRDFLARYDGQAIADRLRNDWLLDLGYKRDWNTFDEQYPLFALDDDLQVKCYALMSRAIKGQVVAGEARELLQSPKDYGDGCQALIVTLVQGKQFSADDVWAQIRLAAESNWSGVARRIGTSIGVPEFLV